MNYYQFLDWLESATILGRIEMVVGIEVCAGIILLLLLTLARIIYRYLQWRQKNGNS